MEAELARISNLPQKDKVRFLYPSSTPPSSPLTSLSLTQSQAYSSLLSQTLSSSSSLESDLGQWLSVIVGSDFPQIVARQVLADYVAKVGEIQDREQRKEVMRRSLEKLQPRVSSFEEQVSRGGGGRAPVDAGGGDAHELTPIGSQVCTLREQYADLLEADEEFPEAAKVLIGIPLESGSRSDEYKLKVYIRIVRLFLEEEDSTSADTYFNRASLLAHSAQDLETQLQFKLCQARMFDFSRRFAEAASKYHEISYVPALAEEERLQALSAAIICAVLAPAGPTRSRILSSLYRDERSSQTPHSTILSKMFLDQMIRPAEVSAFAASLQPHQLAQLPPSQAVVISSSASAETGKQGPETVLDRAMMEHNVLAASRVYNNITFDGLGLLLGLRPSAAEAMARTMIQQKRLRATLDQIDGLIVFEVDAREGDGIVSNVVAAQAGAQDQGTDLDKDEAAGTAPATKRWDLQIRQTLQLAENVAARCEALLAEGPPAVGATPA
ncbi:SPOSA6832_01648, partial [Sporobolomyces salmonicolor]